MKAIVRASAEAVAQFHDVDPMNVVWHGNYPRFLELGRVAVLDKIGYGYKEMVASGYAWPVVDMRVKFVRPIGLLQPIVVEAGITEWENRLKIAFELRDRATGSRLTRAFSIQVAVAIESGAMLWETPPVLRAKLAPFL